jgi:hypothetical protein
MGYVLAGYGITLATLGAYAANLVWRRRALSRTFEERG